MYTCIAYRNTYTLSMIREISSQHQDSRIRKLKIQNHKVSLKHFHMFLWSEDFQESNAEPKSKSAAASQLQKDGSSLLTLIPVFITDASLVAWMKYQVQGFIPSIILHQQLQALQEEEDSGPSRQTKLKQALENCRKICAASDNIEAVDVKVPTEQLDDHSVSKLVLTHQSMIPDWEKLIGSDILLAEVDTMQKSCTQEMDMLVEHINKLGKNYQHRDTSWKQGLAEDISEEDLQKAYKQTLHKVNVNLLESKVSELEKAGLSSFH